MRCFLNFWFVKTNKELVESEVARWKKTRIPVNEENKVIIISYFE